MSYKVVDWRGKIGSAVSNVPFPAQNKWKGVVAHYSGDDGPMYQKFRAGSISLFDLLTWECNYQMTPGLYDAGFKANGMMYHAVAHEDTIYWVRNPNAPLYHCRDGVRPDSWNMAAIALHTPTVTGHGPSPRTIQTMAEFTLDQLNAMGKGRDALKGHQEISSTQCPDVMMRDFVIPFRNGSLEPGVQFQEFKNAPYTLINPGTVWGQDRINRIKGLVNEAQGSRLIGGVVSKSKCLYISDKAINNPREGEVVAIAVGEKSLGKLTTQARNNISSEYGVNGRDISDVWDGTEDSSLYASLEELVSRHPKLTDKNVLAPYRKEFGIEVPEPSNHEATIDRFLRGNGAAIIEGARWSGLDQHRDGLAIACGIVDHESIGGQNIFGCDHGRGYSGRVPWCRDAVTAPRVQALIDSPFMNGIGLTQLTWWEYVLNAQKMGGAHLPVNQCKEGFRVFKAWLDKYPLMEALGAYNAGERNRRSVMGTYSVLVNSRIETWKQRLA